MFTCDASLQRVHICYQFLKCIVYNVFRRVYRDKKIEWVINCISWIENDRFNEETLIHSAERVTWQIIARFIGEEWKGKYPAVEQKKNKHLYYVILSNGKGIELLIRKLINVYKKKKWILKKKFHHAKQASPLINSSMSKFQRNTAIICCQRLCNKWYGIRI